MKTCFKCGQGKPASEFYKHSGMKDGRLGKCKECTKRDAMEHRDANLEKVRAYDRERGSRITNEQQRRYRKKNAEKNGARRKVAYAIMRGYLVPRPCEKCGSEKTHAHHDDYSKPLDVRWLCPPHHREIHGGKSF